MKVELLKGYRYKFEYTIVRDGKNQLNNSYGGRAGRYGAPFYQEMGNGFVLGSDIMKGLHSGQASLVGERFYKATSPLDRFYGEVSGYEPADGDVVQLPVLRTSFGARFVITNLNESTNAKFRGTCSDFWDEKTQTNGATYEYICSFPDLRVCWAYQGIYSFYLTVMGAHSAFGTNSYSAKYTDVMFKRNKITTVYIQCDFGHGALFSTTEEDMEL